MRVRARARVRIRVRVRVRVGKADRIALDMLPLLLWC